MSLEKQLNLRIQQDGLNRDDSQYLAVTYLQKIAESLSNQNNKTSKLAPKQSNKFSFFYKKTKTEDSKSMPEITTTKGMYIWGDVGRGKTWLMDFFFTYLLNNKATTNPIKKIQRLHFHEFMLEIHHQLQDLPVQPDPLAIIARDMSQKFQLICLDEFHVMDIADAVILHGLLKGLFENGVTIVTTSNRHPDELYKGGSHRERFLPAIELIKGYCKIFHLNSEIDYRKRQEQYEDVYFIPHKPETTEKLEELFAQYSKSDTFSIEAIKISGREVPVVRSKENCIWFSFDTLCRGPRSSSDYLNIAKKYRFVILSEIPILHEGEEGPARRFLNLIDAFYDLHVQLIISSSVIIEKMYQGELLQFEFERALSRLHEMRSHSWWTSFNKKVLQ